MTTNQAPLGHETLRKLAAAGIVVCGIAMLVFILLSAPPTNDKDVNEYWVAGKLLASHANPYDPVSALRLEHEAGIHVTLAQFMMCPPGALIFALPLGFLNLRWAIVVWSLLMIAALVLSIKVLWVLNGQQNDRTHLLAYAFAPVLACVSLGQIVPLALLGLSLFLWLYRTRPLLAGFLLAFFTVKPHLLIPFAVVAALWAIKGKQYRILLGAALGIVLACAPLLYFDHRLFTQYAHALSLGTGLSAKMPNPSSWVHALLPSLGWSTYLLCMIGSVWGIWFFLKHRDWDWNREGLLLILVSLVCAPYSWFQDETLALPAILSAIYACTKAGISLVSFAVLDGLALLLVLVGVPVDTHSYAWTSLAWIGWYLWASAKVAARERIEEMHIAQRQAREAWLLREKHRVLKRSSDR